MLRTYAIPLWMILTRSSSIAFGLSGASCALDDRTLHGAELGSAGEGGEGGSPISTGGGADVFSSSAEGFSTEGSAASNGSTAGSGAVDTATSTGSPLPPSTNADCPDLDHNSVDDCEETLVDNPGFEASANNWEAQAPVEFAWQAAGSAGGDSGSVAVVLSKASDKRTMAGVYQCLEVGAGGRYRVYAQTLIRAEESSAALSVLFHDTSDCSGARVDEASSTMLAASDRWRVLHMEALAPPGTHSMEVRLAAVKEPTVESVEVRFDNVLVREQ